MSEEQNRFSLRKLSVGLASVLIGVSIFGTSQTVKADTVADQNTSTVTSNAQSSDTQKNENAVKSTFSSITPYNNVKSNLIQTQDKGKKDQTDSLNQNPTNSQEANNSNDLQEKSAEKNIVSTSSLQKSNNQSNDHAEDNSQSQLNITKNSQQLNQKVLATNLTETNGETQDISKITDPSKIDASHFADGTRWTPAGWTRTDKNTKVAKSSKLDIGWSYGSNDEVHTAYVANGGSNPRVILKNISFSVDKNDLKQNNKILVGTIQDLPIVNKQSTDWTKAPVIGINTATALNAQIKYNNRSVGNLSVEYNHLSPNYRDPAEIDVYFNVTQNISNLATDPVFNFTFDGNNDLTLLATNNYSNYFSYKNHLKYPLDYSVISNSNKLNYQIKTNTSLIGKFDTKAYPDCDWAYNDSIWEFAGKGFRRTANQKNPSNPQTGYVYKIITLQGDKPDLAHSRVYVHQHIHLLNANGEPMSADVDAMDSNYAVTKTTDNLSSIDLWKSTSQGESKFSNQADGSVLICVKVNFPALDKNLIKYLVNQSYLVNVQDPDHAQQIIDNTVNLTKSWSSATEIFSLNVSTNNQTHQIIDVTPTNVGEQNVGTFIVGSSSHGGQSTSSNLETYKNVKISYIDDDDNSKSVSSDAMTGRQNKASTYTVNIPKGYYLDDNNTSTGYTWNADHTAISYTFNEDQAKNDANPIEIHLKHKHTAVTDSSQLQTTGKRTITVYLPHQDKPMLIIQTVGYKRTGTYDEVIEASKGLDEAEKEGNYTDWVFDADTSNVTVDGQISTQYQAYVLKDGVVNYAPIKLPHINGYKAYLVRNKLNPALFMVSFIAVPSEVAPSKPIEEKPFKPSAPADKPFAELDHKVVDALNQSDLGWTMPDSQPATYTVEVPADDAIIDLSDLVIAEPVHAQTRTQIRVTKRFKLRKHGKKHVAKHLKHRKKAVKSFKKYRL